MNGWTILVLAMWLGAMLIAISLDGRPGRKCHICKHPADARIGGVSYCVSHIRIGEGRLLKEFWKDGR